jgi:hypothetical protein
MAYWNWVPGLCCAVLCCVGAVLYHAVHIWVGLARSVERELAELNGA